MAGPDEWECRSCGGSLDAVPETFKTWEDAVHDVPGVGRYARLLPVGDAAALASADAALRPVDSPRLAEALGVASVRLLPQTLNETGTFKDNEGVLLAAKCVEWDLSAVTMHSSGNTARAYQHYLARAGVECTAFVPEASAYKCPTGRIAASRVISVPGTMADAADAAAAHAARTGAVRLAPSRWKIEGKVPLGLAVAEHCQDSTLIAVTVASGYGPLGMERGIRRAAAAGLAVPQDRTYRLFQAKDAAVLGQALQDEADRIDLSTMIPPERAFEPTLQSTNPNRTLPLVRRLLAETGSRIHAVGRTAVEDTAALFTRECANLGVPVDYEMEKSAYICWTGLVKQARGGSLRPDERVTMIVSGSAPATLLPRD
ncbi:pyridoxal-phosphate dependent enzyme [Streptomyces sp. 900105755]